MPSCFLTKLVIRSSPILSWKSWSLTWIFSAWNFFLKLRTIRWFLQYCCVLFALKLRTYTEHNNLQFPAFTCSVWHRIFRSVWGLKVWPIEKYPTLHVASLARPYSKKQKLKSNPNMRANYINSNSTKFSKLSYLRHYNLTFDNFALIFVIDLLIDTWKYEYPCALNGQSFHSQSSE